ncbi:MAG: PAS domain-containing protein, partial [Deltaproteobacteria bacterium]|nr:PAS domain-containing protein [Deltaproteobacteria bacterium]
MVQAVDRELTSLKLAAQVLATSPTLQNSDLGAFYDRAKAALEQNIGGSSIGLSDAAGRQLLNTLEPLGDQLANAANPIELSTVFKTGRPVVSDVYKDRVLNRPVVNIDVPVVHDNKIIYALSMAILPERFLNLLLDVQLPQDWIATVFDSTGTIVSRTQGMDQFLGQKAPQKLVNRIREVNEDILPYVTLEGTPVISAYSRSGVSNWTVAIAIPSAELAKQLWRSLLWVGVGSAILLLATLWVAWRISAQIAHALRRREAYLSEAESLTHMGTWAWNPQQKKMLHCSDEIFRMYALDPRKGVPSFEQIMQRIHPEDRDRVRESTVESIRSKKECLLEYRVVLPDGTVKHMQSLRRPVLDETGNVVEMVGTSLDLTDRKRAEQERERLIKLEANLSRTNRISMLGELVASLTHELRQPLTGLKASTDACLRWLVRDKPDLEKARAALSRIQRDVTRSDELMNRLRSFYIKGSPSQRRLVDVNETIQQISDLVRREAIGYSISIKLELSDRIPRVEADHVQLQQVLMNLMLNAIEAMKDLSG